MVNKGFSMIFIAVALVIAVGGFFLIQRILGTALIPSFTQTTSNDTPKANTFTVEDEYQTGEPPPVSPINIIEGTGTVLTELQDVTGGTSTGSALILRANDALLHTVDANLPAPEGTNFYEGWLVQKSPLKFFSTGVLVLQNDGTYKLSFEGDMPYPTYKDVVVTLETIKDDTPETHILEGTLN